MDLEYVKYEFPEIPSTIKDYTGVKCGRLTPQKFLGVISKPTYKLSMWLCVCDCGTELECSRDRLRNSKTPSCGCYLRDVPARKIDITGETYGSLTAISCTGKKNGNNSYIWIFECSCGNRLERDIGNVRFRKETSKCDECNLKELGNRSRIHGESHVGSQTYKVWAKIKERCYNPNDKSYPNYGAKGVTMQEDWIDDFVKFRDHVGYPPKDGIKYSLDRIDNNKGYVEGNLRWATAKQQARNKGLPKNNKSGVIGVNFESKKGYNGVYSDYYVAQWKGLNREYFKKCFSIKKYGEELAFFMACEYREQQIMLLNLQGAGYSENHGK